MKMIIELWDKYAVPVYKEKGLRGGLIVAVLIAVVVAVAYYFRLT